VGRPVDPAAAVLLPLVRRENNDGFSVLLGYGGNPVVMSCGCHRRWKPGGNDAWHVVTLVWAAQGPNPARRLVRAGRAARYQCREPI